MNKKPKKISEFKTRNLKVGKLTNKVPSGTGKNAEVNSSNYHPDSLEYMTKKLGRKPTAKEAVELDREWAANKTAKGMATELLMGSKSLNNRVTNKRDLVSRQFKDVVETGKADAIAQDAPFVLGPQDQQQMDYLPYPKAKKVS